MASVRSRRLRNPAALLAFVSLCGLGSVVTLHAATGCSREAEASETEAEATEDADAAKAAEALAQAAAVALLPDPPSGTATAFDPRVSLSPLIKRVGPSVVSIHSFGKRAVPAGLIPGLGRPRATQGTGSGFILSDDGIVITNHHVVDGATKLEVHLADEREFEAKLLGSDPATDLAVLQLEDASGLATVTLGESTGLEVGDWVLAMGSPMGLEHSASVGILSGRGRGSLGLYKDSYIDFLQTDADIAPGSSGGPLFNLKGEVIGVNTAVGGIGGPGFAIPIDQAKEIIPTLRTDGRVVRGWLGASGGAGKSAEKGALVDQVYAGTPAADAGLEAGDVVTKIDGTAVADFGELSAKVAGLKPGHTVLMEVERGDETMELTAVLGERPDGDALARFSGKARRGRRGVGPSPTPKRTPTPKPRTPGIKRPKKERAESGSGPRLGVRASTHPLGLEVVAVESGSLADDVDLKAGDIVSGLNGKPVRDPGDVRRALSGGTDEVDIEFIRDGTKHRVRFKRS